MLLLGQKYKFSVKFKFKPITTNENIVKILGGNVSIFFGGNFHLIKLCLTITEKTVLSLPCSYSVYLNLYCKGNYSAHSNDTVLDQTSLHSNKKKEPSPSVPISIPFSGSQRKFKLSSSPFLILSFHHNTTHSTFFNHFPKHSKP